MKKQLAILAFVGVLASSTLFAQDTDPAPSASTSVTQAAEEPDMDAMSFHEVLKEWFIQGGPAFMTPILICLILGLSLSIEHFITLNLATTNTRNLLGQIECSRSNACVNVLVQRTRNR